MSSPTLSLRQYLRITAATLRATAELARRVLRSLPYGAGWVVKTCLVALMGVGALGAGAYVWRDSTLPSLREDADGPPEAKAKEVTPPRGDKEEFGQVRLDLNGNSLPPGALTRLKTERCRPVFGTGLFAFTPDGKGLLTEATDRRGRVSHIVLLDKDTGKVLRRFGDFANFCSGAIHANGRIVTGWQGVMPHGLPATHEVILYVWEVATGKLLCQFNISTPTSIPFHCEISPDAKFLAIIDVDTLKGKCSLRLWEIAAGKLLAQRKFLDREKVETAAFSFSHDSIILALTVDKTDKNGKEGSIHLRDVRTGKLLRTWEGERGKRTNYYHVAFSTDSNRLIAQAIQNEHRVVHLLDRISGKVIPLNKAESDTVFCSSPDGTILASYCNRNERGVRLWDMATGKQLCRLANCKPGTNTPLVFSPDGKILAGTTEKEVDKEGSIKNDIALWDVATGKELRRCQNSWRTSGGLAFSPDGKILAGMEDIASGISYWEVASGKKLPRLREFQNLVRSMVFTPDGKSVVTVEENGVIYTWDARSGRQRSAFPQGTMPPAPYIAGAFLSPDGQILAAGLSDSDPRKQSTYFGVWDAASGRELRKLEKPHETDALEDFVLYPDRKFLFSSDRKFLAYDGWRPLKGDDHTLVWELATGKLRPHRYLGLVQAITRDSTVLVTQRTADDGYSGVYCLWEIATGKKLGDIKVQDIPLALTFSPNGQELLIAGIDSNSDDKTELLRFYLLHRDKQRGARIGVSRTFLKTDGIVSRLAFSLDGKTLAALVIDGSGRNNTVYLWETATGKERSRFQDSETDSSDVLVFASLSFSPDGRRLASGSWDTSVLIWDVTGRLDDRGRLRPVQLSAQQMEEQWAHLACADTVRGNQAIWTLVAAGQPTVAFLAKQLRPASVVLTAKVLEQLVADLDSATFSVRQKARQQLEALGEISEPHLRQALENRPSLELRRSVDHLLALIEEQRAKPARETLRMLRAIEVLEQIGSPEARKLLEVLSGGAPGARQTEEAKASLARLTRRAVQP